MYKMRVLYRTTPKYYEPAFKDGKLINPSNVNLPFFVGGVPGKNTCKARCEYCFIPFTSRGHEPHDLSNLDEKIELERAQIEDLQVQGFNVTVMIPDTFAWNGKYLESGILNRNKLYDQDELLDVGICWTSGLPLLKGDPDRLLSLAYQNDLRIVSTTSHGIQDEEIPIRGTVPPSTVRLFVKLMHEYNKNNPEKSFKLSLSFPIGTHNLSRLEDYIVYAAFLGADYIRFNRLIDLSSDNHFSHLMLTPEGNREFFLKIKEIESRDFSQLYNQASLEVMAYKVVSKPNIDIAIMVSTDFGFEGEELLSLSEPINRCSGGTNLFAVFFNQLYPCNELFEFSVGKLLIKRKEQIGLAYSREIKSDKDFLYTPEFDEGKILKLEKIVMSQHHRGCIGHTIKMENIKL